MNVTYVFRSSKKASEDKRRSVAAEAEAAWSATAIEASSDGTDASGASTKSEDVTTLTNPPENLLVFSEKVSPQSDKTQDFAVGKTTATADVSQEFGTALKDTPAPVAEAKAYGALAVQNYNLPAKWTPPNSRLILVARSRGGTGATSLAVNLAIELQDRRGIFSSTAQREVALVDLDVQFGTAGSMLDIDDRGGLVALAKLAEEPDTQAVRNTLLHHKSGLKVLPAPGKAIPLEALDELRVNSIIDGLMAENDYVVVDLPPALVYWLEPLVKRADRLLLVTDLAVPSVKSGRRLIDMMREDNPELLVDIVVSREPRPLFQRRLHRDVESALGCPLTYWLPDEVKLSRKAIDRGEPLVEMSPSCAWSRAVRNLARSVEASAQDQKKKTG